MGLFDGWIIKKFLRMFEERKIRFGSQQVRETIPISTKKIDIISQTVTSQPNFYYSKNSILFFLSLTTSEIPHPYTLNASLESLGTERFRAVSRFSRVAISVTHLVRIDGNLLTKCYRDPFTYFIIILSK